MNNGSQNQGCHRGCLIHQGLESFHMVIFQTTFLMRKKLPDGDKHISQHELEAFHLSWDWKDYTSTFDIKKTPDLQLVNF